MIPFAPPSQGHGRDTKQNKYQGRLYGGVPETLMSSSSPVSLCFIICRSRTTAAATSWIMMVDRGLGSWTVGHNGGSRIRDGVGSWPWIGVVDHNRGGSWSWIMMMDYGSWWHLNAVVDPDCVGSWSWTIITTRLDIQYAYSHTLPSLTITPQFISHCCSLYFYQTFSYV